MPLQTFLKLYLKNTPGHPDVTISFDPDHGVRGTMVWQGARIPAPNSSWPYVRLELCANGDGNPTFVICTIAGDSDGHLSLQKDRIKFTCHMILLNGETEVDDDGNRTRTPPVELTMTLLAYSDPLHGVKPTNVISDGKIGSKDWVPDPGYPTAIFPLSSVNEKWFEQNADNGPLFSGWLSNSNIPGPLLQNAFKEKTQLDTKPNSVLSGALKQGLPKRSTLLVELIPANSYLNQTDFSTLGFVFRPGNLESDDGFVHFQLPVNPQPSSDPQIPLNPGDLVPERFFLPIPAPIPPTTAIPPAASPGRSKGTYRLVQRPSDDWLNGYEDPKDLLVPEWLISLESTDLIYLWNSSLERYKRALRTARSVNRLSVLPRIKEGSLSPAQSQDTLDKNGESSFNISAQFIVRLNQGVNGRSIALDDLDIWNFSIRPLGNWHAIFQFDLNTPTPTVHPPDPVYYSAEISPFTLDPSAQTPSSFEFAVGKIQQVDAKGNQIASPTGQKTRIGALDLEFGLTISDDPNNPATFSVLDLSPELDRVPRLIANLKLPVLSITPGGQDGLPASEYAPDNYSPSPAPAELCMDRRFSGSAPVVIPIDGDNTASAGYILAVTELNPDAYSQTVSLALSVYPSRSSDTSSASSTSRVVVIDSDPFLVAEVQYPRLAGSANTPVVATWNSNNPEGAAWQLQTAAQSFALIFPPQGIGEEMPKGTEPRLSAKDQDPVTPLDFRFSPTAAQILQPSYTPQNFADAPWNLRRILGYPGQRDAGAGVVQLNFELLYGLSCSVNAPFLRLAEIFSLIGRIAGRVAPPQFNTKGLDQKKILGPYEQKRWNWSVFAELYSKRVALLEPRASGSNYGTTVGATGASAAPEVFTISDGMSCTFRGKADLFYSVDPTDIASVDDDTFPTSDVIPNHNHSNGLMGGVSWPFESPRIFHATVRNPKSHSASASGLALSPLGGTGTVKSGFDNDLSTITSATEIGRTSKVSVARLGRIGVFHNLARYVIDYERDTSVPAQFQGQQTAFANRPVLRKVREFVEILEPVANLPATGQAYPGSGCVLSIEFKQRIIPVTSAWSSNVGDTGWKIPLWYEPASKPAKPGDPPTYIYELPEIVFNLAGADGADVECGILSVDKLFFYTETDAKADSDPHNWPVVSGVDFLPIPPPAPNPAYTTGNPHEIPAFDAPTPFGLASFTHQLDKGHGRVNIANGRGAKAIGANLASVTLQRAPTQISSLQNQIQGVYANVRSDLFSAVRAASPDLTKISNIADQVCTTAGNLANQATAQVANPINSLVSAAQTKEAYLLQNWFQQFSQEINQAADEVNTQLQADKTLIGETVAQATAKIAGVLDNEVDAFAHRLDGLNASANGMAQFFQRLSETLTKADTDLASKKQEIIDGLTNAGNQTVATANGIENYVASIKASLSAPIDHSNAFLTQVRTQVLARAESWMPAATLICQHWEGFINPNIALAQSVLTQADILLAYANSGADDQLAAAEKAVTDAITQAKTAVNSIAFPPDIVQNILNKAQLIAADARTLQSALDNFSNTVKSQANKYINDAATSLNLTAFKVAGDIQALVNAIAQKIIQDANNSVITPAQSTINGFVQKYVALLQGFSYDINKNVSHIQDEVCSAAQQLKDYATKQLNNQLEAGRRYLEDALGRFAESVAQALPPVDITLPSGASLPVLLNHAFGEVPAIPNLGFSLPNAGYFYLPSLPYVQLTPLLTKVKDLVPNLAPLSTLVPSFALSERALPVPNLPNFDLNSIFPDFAGLKLTNLFPALKMPAGSSDAVKITHGLDSSSRTAWVQADIDLKTDTAVIFTAGPMALQIATPRFTSTVRAQAGANGQISKQASGAITGDWQLLIGGSPMITLTKTGLTFDNSGKLHVDVSPDRVQLSAALSFIQQIIAQYTSPDSGFGIYPSATGIETRLSLPIPNTSLGTTGITNLTFNFLFGLAWGDGFSVYSGFGLASPNAPFNLSVFILGGGGHLVATAHYQPGKSLTCQVDMALDASAALAIALGPISGSVHVNLGMRFIFNSGQGDLSLGIFLIIGGEASILSIVSANILLRLDATYSNGAFTCRGLFSISIKICWCFTLSVSEEVSCTLGSGGGMALLEDPVHMPWPLPSEREAFFDLAVSPIPSQEVLDTYGTLANNYLQLVS
jgi:hypothetical protein